MYSHFLVVGGTGMLAEATLALAAKSARQTVLSRGAAAFVRARGLTGGRGMDVDWTDAGLFGAAVAQAISERGPVDLCVVWAHREGAEAVGHLEALLDAGCVVIRVLGSSTGNPMKQAEAIRAGAPAGLAYRFVGLGSVVEAGERRWLTHAEICAGVLECEREGADVVVGEVG